MRRTLIIPASIALLTGMSAMAQEDNTSGAEINASAAVTATENEESLDDLKVDELNDVQLQALEKPKAYKENAEKVIADVTDDSKDAATEPEMTAEADMTVTTQSEEEMASADVNSEEMDSETSEVFASDEVDTPTSEMIESDTAMTADAETPVVDMDADATMTADAEVEADMTAVGGPEYESELDAMSDTAMKGTITELAAQDPRFTTLVALVQQAGLADALNADGEMTVFAPTNAAFDKLDPETLAKLKSGEANDKLAMILKAHVVEGELMSSDIAEGDTTVTTLANTDLVVEKEGDSVKADQSAVIGADIVASNGVIHAVDTVIIPEDETEQ